MMSYYNGNINNALPTEMPVTVVPLHVSPETTFTEAAIPHARNRILTIVLSV
jgi:hypothetical protein